MSTIFNTLLSTLVSFLASVGGKLVFALLVWVVGSKAIKMLVKMLENDKNFGKVEPTVRGFALSFVKIALNVLLVISIITILGVPMSSIVAVVASCAAAVGLALQGALSNLAGGIMLLLFHPFKQNDYIEAAGVSGTVVEINLMYTVLITPDAKRITVPNGTLMNSNVIDYSAEEYRRVDLAFACAKTENAARVEEILLEKAAAHPLVVSEKDKPFARLTGGTDTAMQFAVRVWCKNADYWTVYFDLTDSITAALGEAGVQAPATRVISK